MKNRVFIFIIALVITLGIGSGGLCAALSVAIGKPQCEKKRLLKSGITKTTSGTCRVAPCQSQKGRLMLLPDSSSRRFQDEKRTLVSMPSLSVQPQTATDSHSPSAGKFVLKLPSSFRPPPLFTLNCAFIC